MNDGKGATRKYTAETIGLINLFENITGSKVKDCIIIEDGLMFIVDSEFMGRALGAKGNNLRKIEDRVKRKVKVIEFSQNIEKFIRNLVYPIKPREIRLQDDKIEIIASDSKMRGMLIGRDRKNLKRLQELVGRYFNYVIEVM